MFVKSFVLKPVALAALVAVSAFAATAYINQIGYRPGDFKELALVDASGNVDFVNSAGQVVLSVTPKSASYWDASGQNVQLVDFSKLSEAGTYSVKVNGNVLRSDLVVKSQTYEEVFKAAIKWFYYQRASMALESQYAGKWARAAGHTNPIAELHNSTGASGTINSSKGWYDAGDYGRYIVNSGITTYTLLSLYEHFPEYFKKLKWNIPAEGSLPDLLAEIKYNLDWMLTMQAADGGVYHKLTSLGFPGDVMPAQDDSKIYVIGKSTAAAFDFAAIMAMASRIYEPFDAAYASKCLDAAKLAYAWGVQNPNRNYLANPAGVSTGAYENDNPNDEKLLAGTELFITTGDATYKQSGTSEYVSYWGDVSGLATYEKAVCVVCFVILNEMGMRHAVVAVLNLLMAFVVTVATIWCSLRQKNIWLYSMLFIGALSVLECVFLRCLSFAFLGLLLHLMLSAAALVGSTFAIVEQYKKWKQEKSETLTK